MSQTLLTYIYLGLGWLLAVSFNLGSHQRAEERADTDNDGEAERNIAREKMYQERNLRQGDTSRGRPPKEAAEHRASEMFSRPLRTVGLLVGYEVLLLSLAISVTFTDAISSIAGGSVGGLAQLISTFLTPVIPSILVTVLPVIAALAGIVFALVIHQSWKTATDIRVYWAN